MGDLENETVVSEFVSVSDKVTVIIVDQLNVEASEVIATARLQEDLGADSLDVIELMMYVEKDFMISIPDEVVEQVKTVGEVIDYVESRV